MLGDLQFPEAYAYLFVSGSEVTIRRLGAGPELVVCGERSESSELFHGDRVSFGPFEFQVRIDEPSGGRQPPVHPWTACDFEFDDEGPDHGENSTDEVFLLLSDIRRALREDVDS